MTEDEIATTRGGFNVCPREIEEVRAEHTAVREAAVIGVHHERLGGRRPIALTIKTSRPLSRGARRRISTLACC